MAVANGQFALLLVGLKDRDCDRSVSLLSTQLCGPKPDAFVKVFWELMARYPPTLLSTFMVPNVFGLNFPLGPASGQILQLYTAKHVNQKGRFPWNETLPGPSTSTTLKTNMLATLLEGFKCPTNRFSQSPQNVHWQCLFSTIIHFSLISYNIHL